MKKLFLSLFFIQSLFSMENDKYWEKYQAAQKEIRHWSNENWVKQAGAEYPYTCSIHLNVAAINKSLEKTTKNYVLANIMEKHTALKSSKYLAQEIKKINAFNEFITKYGDIFKITSDEDQKNNFMSHLRQFKSCINNIHRASQQENLYQTLHAQLQYSNNCCNHNILDYLCFAGLGLCFYSYLPEFKQKLITPFEYPILSPDFIKQINTVEFAEASCKLFGLIIAYPLASKLDHKLSHAQKIQESALKLQLHEEVHRELEPKAEKALDELTSKLYPSRKLYDHIPKALALPKSHSPMPYVHAKLNGGQSQISLVDHNID